MIKRILFLAFLLANALLSFAQVNRGTVAISFVGSGTETDPYLIRDASELRLLSDKVEAGSTYRGAYFKMTSDIIINKDVLTDNQELNTEKYADFEEWKPIGKGRYPFCGIFDGNGYSISGLYINNSREDNLALFGYFDGTIKNLIITDSYISGQSVAAFVGKTGESEVLIENCHAYARIKGTNYCAGIITKAKKVICNKISNHYKIEGNSFVSGIGTCENIICYNCVNYGEIISLDSYAYGIANGSITCTIMNSINKGSVSCLNRDNRKYDYAVGIGQGTKEGVFTQIVNIGTITSKTKSHSYALAMGSGYYDSGSILYGYYLEFSAELKDACKRARECFKCTEPEMKSDEFLKTLNGNCPQIAADYKLSSWIRDEDGFPTLDFMKPLISGINNVTIEAKEEPAISQLGNSIMVHNISQNQEVIVYNIMGQKIGQTVSGSEGSISLEVPFESGDVVIVNIGESYSKKLVLL